MIVKKLVVHNIGIIAHEEIIFEKALNLFYGDIKVGKTTLVITSVKLLFGGAIPKDILRHDTNEGYVQLVFDNASIKRSFYINKSFEVDARPIEFYINNSKVQKPASAIQKILNPFLLDQDYLLKKSSIERQRYFVELFGVDTSVLDKELLEKTDIAKDLRANIKAFGEINIIPVEKPDVEKLKGEKVDIDRKNQSVQKEYEKQIANEKQRVDKYNSRIQFHNQEIITTNNSMKDHAEKKQKIARQIHELQKEQDLLNNLMDSDMLWLNDPGNGEMTQIKPDETEKPTYLETVEIEEQISDAKANEILYTQYQDAKRKQKEKNYHLDLLRENESRTAAIKQEKIKKLAEISETIGVKDLKFDYSGSAIYQGCHMGMLSTSQLMQLKSDCQALYPNELGIELLDKAESLGKSIFDYTDKATQHNLTILATIVGEKPANVPENIGVFVVDNGKIKK
jgi:hypothetical protein